MTTNAELRTVKDESDTLHKGFDKFVKEFDKPSGALKGALKIKFGNDLWSLYVKQAQITSSTGGELVDNELAQAVHRGIFLTFRRLSGLDLVRDTGPCPMCLESCSKHTNPRATSHVIADAALRAIIGQFDSCMANSIMLFDQGIHVPSKSGPSAIKWKMLCRKCEGFVCNSGEAEFTKLLKVVLTGVNEKRRVDNSAWRYTFAATLLWRAMHVCNPLAPCVDVSAMYQLYDELTVGMRNARQSLARNELVREKYPSLTIYCSALNRQGNNSGCDMGLWYGSPPFAFNFGYANVQIGTFHFVGVFNLACKPELTSNYSYVEDTGPVWNIPEGRSRVAFDLITFEESSVIQKNVEIRGTASKETVQIYLKRWKLSMNLENMTEFQDQHTVLDCCAGLQPVEKKLSAQATVRYYTRVNVVHYTEKFLGTDKFFGNGFNLIYVADELGCIVTTEDSIKAFISQSVDYNGVIKAFCQLWDKPDDFRAFVIDVFPRQM